MSSSATGSEDDSASTIQLFRHSKRPEWGLAILVGQEEGRRTYHFDDGKVRILKEEYCWLLDEVDDPHVDAADLALDLKETASSARRRDVPGLVPVYAFEDQLKIFAHLYPEGFKGEEWSTRHRGPPGGPVLKRHRDAAIASAQERLSKKILDAAVAEERFTDVFDAAVAVLKGTDLASAAEVRTLAAFEPDLQKRFAATLHDLLHGKRSYADLFRDHLHALRAGFGSRPSWRFATALPALMKPQGKVCVRHSTFIRQAASIAPSAFYSAQPRRRAYASFDDVAKMTRKRLEAAGLKPRDLFDIHDFVWVTLRPAAAKLLEIEE